MFVASRISNNMCTDVLVPDFTFSLIIIQTPSPVTVNESHFKYCGIHRLCSIIFLI